MRIVYSFLLVCLFPACGGRSTQPDPQQEPLAADHPYAYRLTGPEGADRFEPSGAAVVGNRLWVVSDKDGWIASYTLPLQPGANEPEEGFQTPSLSEKLGTKLEGLAIADDGSALLLETFDRKVWRCDLSAGCVDPQPVDVSTAVDAVVARAPTDGWQWISFEALGMRGDDLLLGARSYRPKDSEEDVFMPLVADSAGTTALGEPWRRDGLDYSLSDMEVVGDVVWMTWSFESDSGDEGPPSGVAGLLASARLDPKTGALGAPKLCAPLIGKPEGVAVWGKKLIVVFDQDRSRKGTKTGYPLAHNEDYATIIDPEDCK